MNHAKGFVRKNKNGEDYKDGDGNYFQQDFQLPAINGSAIFSAT